jgi:hypothetical protein
MSCRDHGTKTTEQQCGRLIFVCCAACDGLITTVSAPAPRPQGSAR